MILLYRWNRWVLLLSLNTPILLYAFDLNQEGGECSDFLAKYEQVEAYRAKNKDAINAALLFGKIFEGEFDLLNKEQEAERVEAIVQLIDCVESSPLGVGREAKLEFLRSAIRGFVVKMGESYGHVQAEVIFGEYSAMARANLEKNNCRNPNHLGKAKAFLDGVADEAQYLKSLGKKELDLDDMY